MTGLNLKKDQIIEIACIITDSMYKTFASERSRTDEVLRAEDLKPLDDGIEYVIKADKALLDGMDEWSA